MNINKKQIFHKFSDGLEFKPDIGRIKQLGEVFTPYPIVVKMIKDIGISKDKSNSTVIEPASGHGNFGVEIIKYKIKKVLEEIKKDNIQDSEFTKEYEIRSLIALASLYSNDIDKQNVQVLKQRYSRFMSSLYLKYSKNKDNQIPTYYDVAIANILDTNIILSDFINKNNQDIKICFYFRENEKSDNIYRVVMSFNQIINYQTQTLFDEVNNIILCDKINYQNWKLKINNQYIVSQNQPNRERRNKKMEKQTNKIDMKMYEEISKKILKNFNKPEDFRFKYCISNPPYQMNVSKKGLNEDQSIPLYHHFFMSSLSLSLNSSIICPAKWKTGGRGLDDFREFIYRCHDIKSIITFKESKELFPSANIAGGISIINWVKNWNKEAELTVYNSLSEKPKSKKKYIDCLNSDVAIILDDEYGDQILTKIKEKNSLKFDSIVSAQKPYGFRADIFNKKENYENIWTDENTNNVYKIYGVEGKKGGAKRKSGWVKGNTINSDILNNKDKYKLFMPKAFGFKLPHVNLPKIIIAKPKEICSETFLSIGCFNSEEEAKKCLSYIETKFWKYLFTLHWSGMNVSKKSFSLIPLISFDNYWNDNELYKLFNLSKEEIDYIENLIEDSKNGNK